jgi:hypothetical protein
MIRSQLISLTNVPPFRGVTASSVGVIGDVPGRSAGREAAGRPAGDVEAIEWAVTLAH